MAAIEALRRQVATLSAELLVITGATPPPRGLSAKADHPPDVRVHYLSGGSVFDGRAAAFSLARGEIIALTEDHCSHPPDWCTRIVDHFAKRPDLVLLGGAVANGSTGQIEDRMNYWMTFATFAPGQVTARKPCIAQVAIRAAAVKSPPRPGEFENQLIPQWSAMPGATVIDPGLCVRHDQSHGFWTTFAVHFHNGRAAGGFSPRTADQKADVLRALKWTWRDARDHLCATCEAFAAGTYSRSVMCKTLLVAPLLLAHALGTFVGYRHGPGRSPHHLA
jgi:hypothetical protein